MRLRRKMISKRLILALFMAELSFMRAVVAGAASDPTVIPSPDPQSSGFFGGAVDLTADGQTALVGSLEEERAWVFVRNGGGWDLQTRLSAGVPGTGQFGSVVALSADGTVAAVSAPVEAACNQDSVPLRCGAVYIYIQAGGVWTQKAHLVPPHFFDFEFNFGQTLAVSADGSRVLVGRPDDDCVHQPCRGAVFVYERTGDAWNLADTLKASNPSVQAFGVGLSLTLDGNTALIGAPGSPCAAGDNCGEAYVFARSGGTWSERTKLTSSAPRSGDFFGSSVGLSADGLSALIGAQRSPASSTSGSVFAFLQTGGAWAQVQEVPGGSVGSEFGQSLRLASDGRTALVGAPPADCAAGSHCGALYHLARAADGTWAVPQSLVTFPAEALGGFAVALADDGTIGIAGAPGTPCSAGVSCGAVYAFSALPAAAPSIPTLGASGLILLALLLAAGGSLLLLKRRRFGP